MCLSYDDIFGNVTVLLPVGVEEATAYTEARKGVQRRKINGE